MHDRCNRYVYTKRDLTLMPALQLRTQSDWLTSGKRPLSADSDVVQANSGEGEKSPRKKSKATTTDICQEGKRSPLLVFVLRRKFCGKFFSAAKTNIQMEEEVPRSSAIERERGFPMTFFLCLPSNYRLIVCGFLLFRVIFFSILFSLFYWGFVRQIVVFLSFFSPLSKSGIKRSSRIIISKSSGESLYRSILKTPFLRRLPLRNET